MLKSKLPKIIVVLGPTASGKTGLGIALAKKYNGEIVNADSRQVYKEMNIGTAKPVGDNKKQETRNKKQIYMVYGVVHHLMDIIKPNKDFSLADFKKLSQKVIDDILVRGKLPIIVGGTGLYIWAIVDNLDIPKVVPNKKLRQSLEDKPLSELVKLLGGLDPESATKIDLKNPRRVLRALEVVITSGDAFIPQQTKSTPLYDVLQIGLNWPREELYERVNKRVDIQINDGLLEETQQLAKKYPWNLPSMSSIGYRQIGYYLKGEISLSEAIEILKRDTRRYAKKQMTWFKRDKRINWINKNNISEAQKLVKKFLK